MLPHYSTYLIDLDGVIYRGETLVPGAREFIEWLQATHKKFVFPTNNSFASEVQVLEKLARLGIFVESKNILGAGQAAVKSIARRYPGATVYVIGEPPLFDLVRAHGLKVAPEDSNEAEIVLVGLDRSFTYTRLMNAVQAIRGGAKFIAVNRDRLLPVAGMMIPGCGTMVAAIETGSQVVPEIVGKPQPMLLLEALAMVGSQPEEALMIGDGLDTDIQAGNAAGVQTLLVLSGKDTREEINKSPVKPDFVYENLAAVLLETQANLL